MISLQLNTTAVGMTQIYLFSLLYYKELCISFLFDFSNSYSNYYKAHLKYLLLLFTVSSYSKKNKKTHSYFL